VLIAKRLAGSKCKVELVRHHVLLRLLGRSSGGVRAIAPVLSRGSGPRRWAPSALPRVLVPALAVPRGSGAIAGTPANPTPGGSPWTQTIGLGRLTVEDLEAQGALHIAFYRDRDATFCRRCLFVAPVLRKTYRLLGSGFHDVPEDHRKSDRNLFSSNHLEDGK
jgi:hypothetical protein